MMLLTQKRKYQVANSHSQVPILLRLLWAFRIFFSIAQLLFQNISHFKHLRRNQHSDEFLNILDVTVTDFIAAF